MRLIVFEGLIGGIALSVLAPPAKRNIRHRIKHLVVEGRETEDREEWKEEIDKFVRSKLSSKEVRDSNYNMLEEIRKRAEQDLQTSYVVGVSLALLFRARARLKTQRATGPDRVPCEVLQSLPWCTLKAIRQLLDTTVRLAAPYPAS